ncbi:porphobilinogen synthase [SAR202 cluster bacterium AD-804-J14_MRT_500m]|nr:porphobilinogen synthase [SAR202 cluster bacterium AD-804-J14_MRT_500m]
MIAFPELRLRRLRERESLRSILRETVLVPNDLIYPMFVTHGRDVRKEIDPMPGSYNLSLDRLLEEINEIAELRIPGIILFGLPSKKDDLGSEAFHEHGIVQEAVHLIKQAMPNFLVITDVCLCQYTSHGHCGILDNGSIDNDKTIELYARTALSHAQAGADIVAPSGMMDGQVAAIRKHLDREGFKHIPILAYAAKHASAFYGPFRVAADSAPQSGDRRSYQVDPANGRMALREIQADIDEGADIVMIKPALPYLDIIAKTRAKFDHPIAAYNVSGEYSLVKAAAGNEWINEQAITLELLTSIKRAGADFIITYHAKDAARWMLEQ